MEGYNDVSISGMAKVNGGKYRNVDISGLGEVAGDLDAENINVSGVADFKGNVSVKTFKSKGTSSIKGNLDCESLNNSGLVSVDGQLKAENIHSGGRFSAEGGIKAHKIQSRGYVYSGEGVESEEFLSKGAFKIKGLLNSNKVEAIFGGYCYAREIGGEDISIKHSGLFDFSFILGIFGKKERLESELIEGNMINIEYSDVKTVRGSIVKIGEKCIIDQVEYSESLEIHPDSKVKIKTKI